jgi:hypothetical protein
MKTKTITAVFLTLMLALIWSSSAWADRSNIRDNRQKRRIHKGIRSGQITRPEARFLKKEQRRIHRAYDRALADGYLSRHEKKHLNKMQNRASRHIYRAKHNNPYCRHPHRPYHTNVYHYYPAMENGYSDGYSFSAGISDTGWQFAFSTSQSD